MSLLNKLFNKFNEKNESEKRLKEDEIRRFLSMLVGMSDATTSLRLFEDNDQYALKRLKEISKDTNATQFFESFYETSLEDAYEYLEYYMPKESQRVNKCRELLNRATDMTPIQTYFEKLDSPTFPSDFNGLKMIFREGNYSIELFNEENSFFLFDVAEKLDIDVIRAFYDFPNIEDINSIFDDIANKIHEYNAVLTVDNSRYILDKGLDFERVSGLVYNIPSLEAINNIKEANRVIPKEQKDGVEIAYRGNDGNSGLIHFLDNDEAIIGWGLSLLENDKQVVINTTQKLSGLKTNIRDLDIYTYEKVSKENFFKKELHQIIVFNNVKRITHLTVKMDDPDNINQIDYNYNYTLRKKSINKEKLNLKALSGGEK